ncbi:hypothetical protein CSA80_04900 [Candidatus Saccharibacteria bacterium]|nr:MAG: hypothetical protein CSA80_04900 [Candidatus Saccharibacteria bacterium]
MAHNYSAWEITTTLPTEASETDILQHFARFAILAPSGHNTQPWLFAVQGKRLLLKINPERRLGHSGSLAAEPYVSLGSCLETLILAARGFGYDLIVHKTVSDSDNVVAKIQLGKKHSPQPELLTAIKHRASNRNFYDTTPLAEDIIATTIGEKLPGIHVITAKKRSDITYLSQLTAKATRKIMRDSAFRRELSQWVRRNITRKYDGMPGFTQKMPLPVSLIAPMVVRNLDVSKTQAKKDAKIALHSANLLIICVTKRTPEQFLSAGQQYARICITARMLGYATSGVGAAVIDPESKEDVAKHFHLKSSPTAMLRIGLTGKKVRHTPRQVLEMVLET